MTDKELAAIREANTYGKNFQAAAVQPDGQIAKMTSTIDALLDHVEMLRETGGNPASASDAPVTKLEQLDECREPKCKSDHKYLTMRYHDASERSEAPQGVRDHWDVLRDVENERSKAQATGSEDGEMWMFQASKRSDAQPEESEQVATHSHSMCSDPECPFHNEGGLFY